MPLHPIQAAAVNHVYLGELRRVAAHIPDAQLAGFLAHMEALAERLTPARRPQDRGEPECSLQELRALAAIAKQGALTMSELAAVLGVRLSTATHTVDKLVDKGLVERRREDPDRRIVRVGFSRRGMRINRWVVEARESEGRALLGALRPQERATLIAALERMAGSKRRP